MKYAAYDDSSIYAIGNTPEETESRACQDTDDPQATFKIAPISDTLAQRIAEYGWNPHRQSFELAATGYLVEIH
jgi:hypothetical protein